MKSYNLINANIITMDSTHTVNSITISNGKIEKINSPNPNYETKDLSGLTIIPGFIDAHFHLKNFGKRLEMVNLKKINSINEIQKVIKSKIKSVNENEWIIGFGWDQNLWQDRKYPHKNILNDISPNNPIYLTRIDGHSAWVNNVAIEKTGLSISTIDKVDGGSVINDCIMIDNAMNSFKSHLPTDTKKQVKSWIKTAVKEANKMGITGVHDAWQDSTIVGAIKELINEKKFPIRCYGMLGSNDKELLEKYFNDGHYHSDY